MRIDRKIEAYILPTVLIVGTLMTLALLALFSLWDLDSQLFSDNRARKQHRAWLESTLLLWETDSTLLHNSNYPGPVTLFDDDPLSTVSIQSGRWGLYDLVTLSTNNGREKLAVLAGNASSSRSAGALYVCNDNKSFSLAGDSDIKGTVYVSGNGIEYGSVMSDYYTGRPVPVSDIRMSQIGFPELDTASLDSLAAITVKVQISGTVSNIRQKKVSFFDPVEIIYADDLRQRSLSGNLVVCSERKIEIDSTSRLNDIIIIAPKVTIREGFRGSLQVIAIDSVIVERGVKLDYPSGILMYETTADSFLAISDSSMLDGYVVFRLDAPVNEQKRTPNYSQGAGSRVRGLVWVDGISQIHGTVMGNLYLNRSAYFASHGYYTGILYNASVYESREMAFPLWMESDYRKKTIKWLD